MTKRPHRQADDLCVISDALQSWSGELSGLADRARALAELPDRAAVRAGLAELAGSLDDLAAMLSPAAS
jgi:hypothetical protein